MKVEIENYNNIKKLEYNLEDEKINFLIGISGCGKSSIVASITEELSANNVPFYDKSLKSSVKINGDNNFNMNNPVYNLQYMEGILISKTRQSDIYNILVTDSSTLNELKEEYDKQLIELMEIKDKIYAAEQKISILKSSLKIVYQKSDPEKYTSNCIIRKVSENVQLNQKLYLSSKKFTSKKIKWIKDGVDSDEYKVNKCPFCSKKLTAKKKDSLNNLMSFDSASYEKINKQTGIFDDLKIKIPEWTKKREVNNFDAHIRKIIGVYDDLINLKNFITEIKNVDITLANIDLIKPTTLLKELFPDIHKGVLMFNEEQKNIKRQLGKIKSSNDRFIRKNINEINEYLTALGLSYQFVKDTIDENEKVAKFYIKHSSEKTGEDRVPNLSYGEKNLIGLILFLIANKKNEFLIIDDPASSFDECRRKIILDILYKLKSQDSTVLVLSHDHVFSKLVSFHVYKAKQSSKTTKLENLYLQFTGNIDYIETYEDTQLKSIDYTDYSTVRNFIKERVHELRTNDFQSAISYRMYYELNKKGRIGKATYGYFSAIIHKKDKELILAELKKYNLTEEDVLEKVKSDFSLNSINILNPEYIKEIDLMNLCILEKIFYLREILSNTNANKIIKDEINNIIHLNATYVIGLNPYKYNIFSKNVFNSLKVNNLI